MSTTLAKRENPVKAGKEVLPKPNWGRQTARVRIVGRGKAGACLAM